MLKKLCSGALCNEFLFSCLPSFYVHRALKTRGNTPKYGLIFHSTFIGKAQTKNKGRISRYLANKCAIASRIDCFAEFPTEVFGSHLRTQVEDRLKFFDSGDLPKKNVEVMHDAMGEASTLQVELEKKQRKREKKERKKQLAALGVVADDDAEEEETPKKKKKSKVANEDVENMEEATPEKKKKKKKAADDDAEEEEEAAPKSSKKKKNKQEVEEEAEVESPKKRKRKSQTAVEV